MTIEDISELNIDEPDKNIMSEIKERWDSIAKPLDGLGLLEEIHARTGAMERTVEPVIDPAVAVTFCGDHGITAAGVSQTDSSVTRTVAGFLGRGESSLGHMAAVEGCDTIAVDVGIIGRKPIPGVRDRKIREGTRDFRYEPAMTREEALQAVSVGIEMAEEKVKDGYRLLIPGEMGIGNTTAATAMLAAFTGLSVESITGTGAGLDEEGLKRKKAAISEGLSRWKEERKPELFGKEKQSPEAALDIISNFGGYELAAMTGLCIGGALFHTPVVLDGYLSAVAGFAAERLKPGVKGYLIASHSSREPGAETCMKELELTPVIYGNFRLGEGTGALTLLPMLRMADAVYRNMVRFDGTDITAYKRIQENKE